MTASLKATTTLTQGGHPNYLIVQAEIAVLPLAFGAWEVALLFSVLNGQLLRRRIRIEDEALAPRRNLAGAR